MKTDKIDDEKKRLTIDEKYTPNYRKRKQTKPIKLRL